MTPDTLVRRIEEERVDGKPLGRHIAHDPRSFGFRAELAPTVTDCWHKATGLPLDQVRGSCTAHALVGALNSAPDYQGHLLTDTDANRLYDAEIVLQGLDPAVDDPGGTGLWICQVARKEGLISSYRHAFGIDEALRALTLRPVITGVNWYSSFDGTDAHGLINITPDAHVRGGHEFVVEGISLTRNAVICWQSWGAWGSWGGRFWLPIETWDRLLHEDGDVVVPYVTAPAA